MRRGLFIFPALLLALSAEAEDAKKPPVPPGTDPGGIAVAIIETGVDYTLPAIAQHLARDGEGEVIGWDMSANDRRPYKNTDDLEDAGYSHRGTAMARTMVKRAPRARLEPVSIAPDDEASLVKGLAFVAHTPAKVAVLSLSRSSAALWSTLREAMQKMPDRFLLVVAAGEDEGDRSRVKEHLAPKLDDLDNVIVVTACDRAGNVLTTAEGAATNADIAVNSEAFTAEPITNDAFSFKPEASIAAAEVGAMAARLLSTDSALDPAEVKAAILAVAAPFPGGNNGLAKAGFIAEPWRHFRPR